ncbi:spore germination protein [Paenibacillus sp. N4]|uniref:spore germination protein n=1 Tax=Paenibacillus vietnamensis TaxID=2590547 RepID=UPI001CD15D4C|nr:spore germination protein [Paenibacillus vietnamensis]MCA0758073.1 spore germination protein [Paenibacillus vietnamensis]
MTEGGNQGETVSQGAAANSTLKGSGKDSGGAKTPISKSLDENRQLIEDTFSGCYDLVYLPWSYGPKLGFKAFSVYFDTLVEEKKDNYMKSVLQDLVTHEIGPGTDITLAVIMDFFEKNGVSRQSGQLIDDFEFAVARMLRGDLVVFIDGWDKALSFQTVMVQGRQITEPISEPVVLGPRESTVENLKKNIGLIRTRVRSPRFKLEAISGGGETQTQVVYGYIDGSVNPETLAEFKRRIGVITDKEILDISFVEELIEDSTYSPFPQFRYTERPDVVAAALIDGKIVVMCQGTGMMMLCPGLFSELLQSSEDYYQRTVVSTLIRLLRFIACIIALTLPSIYIALTTYHPELIPSVLLLAIVDAREGIPFPAFFEALIMEFFFELLREAGVRLPRPVGSAVSIVGALVIGEAAISAGIASPIMVVIVALTGIASFAVPQYNTAISLRLLRFPLMAVAALLGGFGLLFGLMLILLHLVTLRSLGQPYFAPIAPIRPRQLLDVFVRAPLKQLVRSPRNRHMHMSINRKKG